MYAIIETGGKQYTVKEGDKIRVEKLDAQVGDAIEFDKVLVLGDGEDVKFGRPYLEGAKVPAKVLAQDKAKKVVVFKFKAKKNYRNKRGHRQPYTFVEIGTIA